MTKYTMTKTRFREGIWEGIVTASAASAPPPEIVVTLRDQPVDNVTVTEVSAKAKAAQMGDIEGWLVEVPVPVEAVGDGVQTFLIVDAASNTVLENFTLIAGEALADDIRAEIELLRAELDMLKRAFRRHCLETM